MNNGEGEAGQDAEHLVDEFLDALAAWLECLVPAHNRLKEE